MGLAFWIKRFLTVWLLAFAVLLAVELLKGHGMQAALAFSAAWSLLAASIFTAARIYQARRGRHCALCNDIPAAKRP